MIFNYIVKPSERLSSIKLYYSEISNFLSVFQHTHAKIIIWFYGKAFTHHNNYSFVILEQTLNMKLILIAPLIAAFEDGTNVLDEKIGNVESIMADQLYWCGSG